MYSTKGYSRSYKQSPKPATYASRVGCKKYGVSIETSMESVWGRRVNSLITLLYTPNGYVIHKETCDHIIDQIIHQLYNDRYMPGEKSDIHAFLPNEKSTVNKHTNLVRMIAHRYYFYYIKQQSDSEWCDIKYDNTIRSTKNNALELYRKDLVFCRDLYSKNAEQTQSSEHVVGDIAEESKLELE